MFVNGQISVTTSIAQRSTFSTFCLSLWFIFQSFSLLSSIFISLFYYVQVLSEVCLHFWNQWHSDIRLTITHHHFKSALFCYWSIQWLDMRTTSNCYWIMKQTEHYWIMKQTENHWIMKQTETYWIMKQTENYWIMKQAENYWIMKRTELSHTSLKCVYMT